MTERNTVVYYGQVRCAQCENKAYWRVGSQCLCGVHSRRAIARTALPKQPAEAKNAQQREALQGMQHEIDSRTMLNRTLDRMGDVILTKMRMMKPPEFHKGYLRVFPNNRHGSRRDGFGCPSLSPMRLGPVQHGQPGVPDAHNIENFHQGSKCFAEEMSADGKEPAPLYFANRDRFYLDPVPHRHKYRGTDPRNRNIPVFFGWVAKNGVLHKLSYVESRQFYCTFYERLTQKNEDLAKLRALRSEGTNLQICGFDARPLVATPAEIHKAYLDPSAPFGHELVLFTLLTCPEEAYPWRLHKTFDF